MYALFQQISAIKLTAYYALWLRLTAFGNCTKFDTFSWVVVNSAGRYEAYSRMGEASPAAFAIIKAMSSYHVPDNIQYALFDMDGTLVDTEPEGPGTFVRQLAKYDVTPTDEECKLFEKVWRREGATISEEDFLKDAWRKYQLPMPSTEYVTEFYGMYCDGIIAARPLPGVNAFLKEAATSTQIKLALVTTSKVSQVAVVLEKQGWKAFFDVIVCEEDTSRHKPDPEPFIVAMKKLRASPAETIVFEDSRNGVLAGRAAGCTVVGLRVGNAYPQDLSAASVIVDSFINVRL